MPSSLEISPSPGLAQVLSSALDDEVQECAAEEEMFAVPGYSASAETLKSQKEPKSAKPALNFSPQHLAPSNELRDGSGKNPKKRKRRGNQDKNPGNIIVTDENLADLWKKYIEGKDITAGVGEDETKLKSEQKRKKRKKSGIDGAENKVRIENNAAVQQPDQNGEELEDKEHDNSVEHGVKAEVTTTSRGDKMSPDQLLDAKQSGKAKYQQRKLLALKKKELKARLQSTSSLPPTQPNTLNQSTVDENQEDTSLNIDAQSPPLSQPPSSASPDLISTATTLTPLQSQMRSKLIAARFRHLNETLYTTASTHALNLFTESPSSFASYHAGFRAQVSVWPQNPVDTFIVDLKARAPLSAASAFQSQKKKWRDERKGKNKTAKELSESPNNSVLAPLPRSQSGTCTIADLGCGDAKLAASLQPYSTTHSLRLLSYDLATGDGPNAALITVADLCQLPLKDSEVDLAVLCLALMGTNWVDGVDEVGRVVRTGGEVWVAEIRSRFQRGTGTGRNQGDEGSRGKKNQKSAGTTDKGSSDDADDRNISLDLDAEPLPKRNITKTNIGTQTGKDQLEATEPRDLDPFIDIWRRRGFVLNGPIDQSNRMFVRMKFIKSGKTPLAGVTEGPAARSNASERTANKYPRMNANRSRIKNKIWIRTAERDPEKERQEEAKVLKPCVYKIR